MTTLLREFYCLPMETIVLCFALLSFAYLQLLRRFGGCRWFRRGILAVLAIWFAAALWITILRRVSGMGYVPEPIPFHSYRELFSGGSREILRTNFMNVALFYPAGLLAASLLPEHRPRRQRLLALVMLFALFSFGIEYAQYRWTLGKPEIDDVIHNTLGAVFGTLPIHFTDLTDAS